MSEREKYIIQDCNINFLMGSGLSLPYLTTLGNIEILLTELEKSLLTDDKKQLIRASIYKKFFDGVISKNPKILAGDVDSKNILKNYIQFLEIWNSILLRRKSTILSKEVNIFTTNVDVFLDKALEDLGVEYNDGFNGRFKPSFSLSNFKKSRFKRSLHYDNTAEIPVFNLLKLHGSLSWAAEGDKIIFPRDLSQVTAIANKTISAGHILAVPAGATLASLDAAATGKSIDATVTDFMTEYEKLLIVNPTKEKFKLTLLNQTYYELLRLYSNELEKENTVLYVMGFSFSDEHIREITLRAANSNPTLIVKIIAFNSDAKSEIEARLDVGNVKNRNVKVISPPQEAATPGATPTDKFQFNFENINAKIFGKLFDAKDDPAAS
jgi:SIR2-like domain